MRHIFSLLLAAMLLAGLLTACYPIPEPEPSSRSAGDIIIQGDYVYKLNDDGSAYLSNYRGTATELTLPADLGGHPLTVLGEAAFLGDPNLTRVTVPEGVVELGRACFSECPALVSVSLPSTLRVIGPSAFNRCPVLADLALPEGLLILDDLALFRCAALERVTLPASLIRLGTRVLDGTAFLAGQSGDVVCGEWYVRYCGQAEAVTVPEGVTAIAGGAFFEAVTLRAITLPEGVVSIGDVTFYGCTALEHLTLPASLSVIGTECFVDCRNLHVSAPADSWALAYAEEKGIPFFNDAQ